MLSSRSFASSRKISRNSASASGSTTVMRPTASCGEEALDVDDSDEPAVVQSGACEKVRLGLLGDRRQLADVGDLVDREAGAKPAVLGDEETLRVAVAR